MAEIRPMFAVPFAQAMHPGADALNRELRALVLAREAAGARFANPNPSLQQQPGVYESEFEFFSSREHCVQELKRFCWSELAGLVQQINGYSPADMARLQIFSHTWFHVTRRGGFVINHIHPMASWSGVYCVDPGGDAPGHQDSGVLRFQNPHYYSNVFLDAGNLRPVAPYHHGSWNIRFRAGELVMFPSWVPHEVLPFHGDGERITIAFNCWFGQGGQ